MTRMNAYGRRTMSKAKWSIAAAIIAGVAVFSVGMLRAQNDLQEQDRRDGTIPTGRRDGDISAPVVYEDLMLVLASGDGAAAVVFTNPTERGVSYRFRYESRDGMKNTTGAGAVFEERENGRYAGGRLFIQAGPFRLGWSDGGAARGWVYYDPEKLKVQIAHAKDFDDRDQARFGGRPKKLDLKRFMK